MLCHRYFPQSKPHVSMTPSTVPAGKLLPSHRSGRAEGKLAGAQCPALTSLHSLEGHSVGTGIATCSGPHSPLLCFSHFANLGLPTGLWSPFPSSWHHYYEAKSFVNLYHFFMKL